MGKTKIMYRIPLEMSKRAREIGVIVEEVEVTVGRNFFSDSLGYQYFMEPDIDVNGHECFIMYKPKHCAECVLYNSKKFAQDAIDRRVLRQVIARTFSAYALNLEQLKMVKNIMEGKEPCREFHVNTPDGVLRVYAKHEADIPDDYPGVFVDLLYTKEEKKNNYGDCIACVEYDSNNRTLQVCSYPDLASDEPAHVDCVVRNN